VVNHNQIVNFTDNLSHNNMKTTESPTGHIEKAQADAHFFELMIDRISHLPPNFAVFKKTMRSRISVFWRKHMISELLHEENFLIRHTDISTVRDGTFIMFISGGIEQSALLSGQNDGSFFARNVIDLSENEFISGQGIIHPEPGDPIYEINSRYTGAEATAAINVIKKSALFERYEVYQDEILEFVRNTFAPAYILYLKNTDALHNIFIPIQQRFRIGRFSIRDKWENINTKRFRDMLDRLITDEYVTYMGYLPHGTRIKPVFYSLGTETHLETDMNLKKEPFLYSSNCGGNIKLHRVKGETKYFLVDAGSSYKGNGVNARIDEAQYVSESLNSLYPEHRFIPVEGRGAIGSHGTF